MDKSKDKAASSKKKVHNKAAKFPLPTLKATNTPIPVTPTGPSIGHLDLLEVDFDLHQGPGALSTPAPLPTRLRPGTPSPSRTGSPHVKQKIRQMSMSAQDDLDGAKIHPVTGSKSAPVPRRDHGGTHHHRPHKASTVAASPQPLQEAVHHHHHHHGHHDDHVKFHEPETISLLDRQVMATINMGLDLIPSPTPSTAAGNISVVSPPPKKDVKHPKSEKVVLKVRLAVVKGSVFIPSRTKARPGYNSFLETSELGPPGAERRWLIDMKGFREDEITFTLDGVNLKVEGKQTTRPGKLGQTSETIAIPINYDIESLKVYRNKTIGTLVLAYMPENNGTDLVK